MVDCLKLPCSWGCWGPENKSEGNPIYYTYCCLSFVFWEAESLSKDNLDAYRDLEALSDMLELSAFGERPSS